MTKVENFKNNFWKRRVTRAVVTPLCDGSKYNIELYSLDKSFLGSRVIPYYQLSNELRCLGFKSLDFHVRVI